MVEDEEGAFGDLLARYRTQARWSQQRLADKLGVHRSTIVKWEQGDALPKDRTRIDELASCLHLTDQQRERLLKAALFVTTQRLWSVPLNRTTVFTGREAVLEQLHTTLATEQRAVLTQAITGLGGIGKTQTALEYAHRYQEEYHAVLWAEAESPAVLIRSLLRLAQVLALPEREATEQEVIVAAFQRWLETHTGWLLVLDNVEALPVIQPVLPTRGQGHILVTTRSHVVGTLAHPLPLENLTPEEGALLVLRRSRLLLAEASLDAATEVQKQQAQALSATLGGLPLALDQAGAYIEETGCGLKAYLVLFKTRRKALLGSRGTDAQGHPDPVAVTWSVAFDRVEQASPVAADLLRLCALLHPDAIPENLFRDGVKELPSVLQEAVNDQLGWNAALAALRRFSLIERQAETQTLSVHRLVQAVLQDALPDDERRAWAERAVRLVNAAFPSGEFENWGRCQQLLPHALVCANHIEQWHLIFGEAARLLNQAGYYLKQRAQYVEVFSLYQRALGILEQMFGPTHPYVATSMNNLAMLYHEQGQYAKALPLIQHALVIREQELGPIHPDVASSLNNLAVLYEDLGQYTESLLLKQRALMIREQVLGPTHPDVAQSLNNLAVLYGTLGQYAEALPLHQRALAIREQVLGPIHPDVAQSLNNLAALYYDQGQYAEALPFMRRAIAIREQVLGPTHPDVATDLNNLAGLYYAQGQFNEALPVSQRALAILMQVLPEHPNTANCMENTAAILHAMGQDEQADEFAAHARAIRAKRKETDM